MPHTAASSAATYAGMYCQNGVANMDSGFPTSVDQLSPDWLTQVLLTAGVIDDQVQVASMQVTPFAVGGGFYSDLYRALLDFSGHAPEAPDRVILKMGVKNEGHHDIATTLEFYDREVRFYQLMSAEVPVKIPRIYGAGVSEDGHAVMLVMEDVSDERFLDQVKGVDAADAFLCVKQLAIFHAHYWGRDFSEFGDAFWPYDNEVYRAAFPEFIRAGWPVIKRVSGDWLPQEFIEFGDKFDQTVGSLIQAMDGRDTLIHGDWRATNMTVSPDGDLTVLDFQVSGLGEPAYDLGYFISQSISEDVRRKHEGELIDFYLETLIGHGGKPDISAFHRKYAQSVLLNCIVPIADHAAWDEHSDKLKEMTQSMLKRSVSAVMDGGYMSSLP